MVLIGLILLIVGVVLLLAPIPFPNADAVGWLFVVIGAILLLVALLVGSGLDLGGDHARSSWGLSA